MEVLKLSKRLTDFEREAYRFIEEHGELLTTNMPIKMMGAIPNLKNKGLIVVFKRRTSSWSSKRRKFVKVIERPEKTSEEGSCL